MRALCDIYANITNAGDVIEATAGYLPALKEATLKVIPWSQGLFGFVGGLEGFVEALTPYCRTMPTISSLTPPATPPEWDGNISLAALAEGYRQGLSVVTVVQSLYKKIEGYAKIDPAVWIHLQPLEAIVEAATKLQAQFPDRARLPPLYGIPFSIKDSFDVRGLKTTTACPPLAFTAEESAVVYEKVIAAGALFIGKANLDQLATGLSGCRSPYGIPRSVYNKDYISGGSSSGNAVSVGAGLVTFAIATDTAGSGRVPALFNGVVGFKPTRGTISARGLTPACASLDCVTLMAKDVEDLRKVWTVCTGYDEDYIYAKNTSPQPRHVNSLGTQATTFSFGIPPPGTIAMCSPVYQRMFAEAIQVLQSIGGVLQPLDWTPFGRAGKLLYDGTLVSERLASLPDGWFQKNQDELHPTIREIFAIVVERQSTAVQAFRDLQAMAL
jgi:allophanate hydrolase